MNGDNTFGVTNLSSQFAGAASPQSTQLNSPPNMGTQQFQLQGGQVQSNNAANQGPLVMQINNQVDARVIKTITMSNVGYQAFESISSLVKPGQSLDVYCDSAVIYQIYVNLAIQRYRDKNFTIDPKSDIRDIVQAMKTFYNKGLQLQTARTYAEKIRYEHVKDPEKTLLEKEEANSEFGRQLGILTTLVDEEALPEEEVKDIIKIIIKNMGTSSIPGKKVQAIMGIKKMFEKDMAGSNPHKSIMDFQANSIWSLQNGQATSSFRCQGDG